MNHAEGFAFFSNYQTLWNEATEGERKAGAVWYDAEMQSVLDRCPSRHSPPNLACALAHLSPRIAWEDAKQVTIDLAYGLARPAKVMTAPWTRAQKALESNNPFSTFGPRALKTLPFARALAGDPDAVVIDVHMISAGMGLRLSHDIDTKTWRELSDVGRVALKNLAIALGEPARTVQATIWLRWLAVRGQAVHFA